MERGEWEDDPEYPRAPLPAHERTWRHPSEQGATQWVLSEPPLVVGRGLTLATGTIGVVLAVGLLWLMIPHNNRGGGVAAQGSTTVRTVGVATSAPRQSTAAAISNTPITTASSLFVATTMLSTATTVAATTNSGASPTTWVERPSTTVALLEQQTAMAVALAPGHFVATTAASVGDASTVIVQLPSGENVAGTVYSVDANSGIAVIVLPDGVAMTPMAASEAPIPTDAAVVLTPDPSPVSVWRDDTGTQVTADPSIQLAEGALVLDAESRLIGMCTLGESGVHVVDAAAMLEAINNAIANESPVWLGVKVGADDDGNHVVVAVDADGPSAVAGTARLRGRSLASRSCRCSASSPRQ